MKSIFHSDRTVTVDGTEFRLEADQTIEGTELFEVTNCETGESKKCRRTGATPERDGYYGFDNLPETMQAALRAADEVDI